MFLLLSLVQVVWNSRYKKNLNQYTTVSLIKYNLQLTFLFLFDVVEAPPNINLPEERTASSSSHSDKYRT